MNFLILKNLGGKNYDKSGQNFTIKFSLTINMTDYQEIRQSLTNKIIERYYRRIHFKLS